MTEGSRGLSDTDPGHDPDGDPCHEAWRKKHRTKGPECQHSTHLGGVAKTAENGDEGRNRCPVGGTGCQPRPRLALVDLPTETVDNPVHETWRSACRPRQHWDASTVQKIPAEKCFYKNHIVIRSRTKRCWSGGGDQMGVSPRGAACALKSAEESTKVDNLHRDGEELAPPTGLEPVTYGLTVRRSTD